MPDNSHAGRDGDGDHIADPWDSARGGAALWMRSCDDREGAYRTAFSVIRRIGSETAGIGAGRCLGDRL